MDKINRFNTTRAFLAIGVFSAAVSAALWAWMWHYQGVSIFNLGAGHGAALFFYLVSLAALTLFIGRLRGRHLAFAALALTGANAVLWITYWLIHQYYFQFFALTHPFPIQAYDSRYVIILSILSSFLVRKEEMITHDFAYQNDFTRQIP